MLKNKRITITSSAIKPRLDINKTQMIFQRHCDYDGSIGIFSQESVDYQKEIVTSFVANMQETLKDTDISNTYFLFTASSSYNNGFKRCVDTTNIAMDIVKEYFKENNIPLNHIINLNEEANYNNEIHEDNYLSEPKIFTGNTSYLKYLAEKNNGINKDFWMDFEEDRFKEKREELGAEGPDQIVDRAVHYINVLKRYSDYFHMKKPNSRLIIWCGTHYDLISPLIKQRVLKYEKSDTVLVECCGGISLVVNNLNEIIADINGIDYWFDSEENKQLCLRY